MKISAKWVQAVCLLSLSVCRQDMHDQPRYEPLEESSFFDDRRSARPLPEGTVARGHLQTDEHLYQGTVNAQFAKTFPFSIDRNILERGREQYDIFCSPCHDRIGAGRGMIVHRGFPEPPSFHIERLRQAPAGHFFDVITNGYGRMYSYASRVSPRDRWAITAYIRALQLSQNAPVESLSDEERNQVNQTKDNR